MKNELLKLSGSLNVIIVNWKVGAGKAYGQSTENTKTVGEKASALIVAIKKNKAVAYSKFHVIGHSLGAHAAGFVGKGVIKAANDKVGRITGLDPAGFKFARKSHSGRLSYKDADFVDVIHTNDGTFLRLGELRCHVDFYPNGGRRQPGCPNVFSFNSSLCMYNF
ncbi:hypothetical protein LOTGIDRAFT_225572 [Lottia gigantea]|uniref:Lipase domain-containing protein n=1 Tax=Lottia gigantea TaxID=225164 RepID=V4B0Y5_LOTGI|nr:hypothetical protein LOTGIDRAFT_225572 [Lottia gigantea]ESP00941.1 hypothetical protein LOTGIDRAFT_225572 [Lottia gigantea]